MCTHRFFPRLALLRVWCGLWLTCLVPMSIPMAGAQTLVLAAAESAPTAYIDHGKQTGLLVDVVEEVFKRAGYRVALRLMPWARCILEVKEGKIDGIFSIYLTPERQAFLSYAGEVLITQVQAFFVRKDATIIGAFNQALRAMTKDGTYDAIFSKYGAGPEVRKTNLDRQ